MRLDKVIQDYSAGEFRTLMQVQAETETPDGAGGFVSSWATVASIWCHMQDVRGQESFGDKASPRVRSETYTGFVTWHRDDITTRHRLLASDGTLYNVRRVIDVAFRHKFTEIWGERGVEQ